MEGHALACRELSRRKQACAGKRRRWPNAPGGGRGSPAEPLRALQPRRMRINLLSRRSPGPSGGIEPPAEGLAIAIDLMESGLRHERVLCSNRPGGGGRTIHAGPARRAIVRSARRTWARNRLTIMSSRGWTLPRRTIGGPGWWFWARTTG